MQQEGIMHQGSYATTKPYLQLLILLFLALVGLILTGIFSVFFLDKFHVDIRSITVPGIIASQRELIAVRILSIIQDLFFFMAPALSFAYLFDKKREEGILNSRAYPVVIFLLITLLWAILFPFIAELGSLNEKLIFPNFLKSLEKYFQDSEKGIDQIITQVLNTQKIDLIIFNLISMAFFPAISEEFFFRGAIQKLLLRIIKNPHIAILIGAIIFSAVHGQIYGFLPRLILGLILGYLFYWSGSIWPGIFFHCINNGIQIILSSIPGFEAIDPTKNLSNKPIGLFIGALSGTVSILFLWYIFKEIKKAKRTTI